MPVGISDEAVYDVRISDLSAGDSIVLYTDGVSEAQNEDGHLYGTRRFADVAGRYRHQSPDRLAAACLDDLREFRGPAAVSDDLTM